MSRALGEEQSLYRFVGNQAIDDVDAFGLCKPFLCGPDVGGWLGREMERNAASDAAGRMWERNAKWWSLSAKAEAYSEWISLVKAGAPWDFKTFLNPANADSPKVGNCPWESCRGFLTICGACYRFDVVANIHFGYVGKASGFSDLELLGGAAVAQIIDNFGDYWWDEPEDQEAIRVGIKVYAGSTLCDALKEMQGHLPPPQCYPCPHKWAK